MDRSVITGMVEDYWRARIPAMQSGGLSAALEVAQRFEERMEETANLMPPLEAAAFRQALDAERERLLQEYTDNPVALKTRLGINLGVDAPRQHRTGGSGDLGGLVVRTAARATVWESVWALFRAFR
jgi:hypothetical protein